MQKSYIFRCGIFLTIFVLLGLVISLFFSLAQASQPQLSEPPDDQVVVKPKHGVAISTILSRYNTTLLGMVPETNLYFLKLPAGQTASQRLPVLNADPDLYYAEPNYYTEGSPNGGVIMFGANRAPSAGVIMFGANGTLVPTPPGGLDQWAWIKTRLAEAQRLSTGQNMSTGRRIIVAVLDTGMAADHSLLSSSITAGYDFVGMTDAIYDLGDNLDADGDGLVDEEVGHGTHVSGIIVTAAPGVQIMPIRVLNSDGVGTYWEVAQGIRWAVDHNADIINMSLSAPRLTPSLADALNYAASHGVIVVAAAGVGPGPNYPAAYSDRLAVVGVGATGQTDNIAWFSGGQVADTDVFAPGVDIYSAFPYNSYSLGSGTSMAAPMVTGEAALLKARYPDWSPAQIVECILGKVDPVPGASVGRIDLADAITTSPKIDYSAGDFGVPSDSHIKPRILVVNDTPENIPLNQLKLRYWYTIDSNQEQAFYRDYATTNASVAGAFVRIPDNSPNKTNTSDTYLEISFPSSTDTLAGGGRLELGLRFNKNDWSAYNELNDFAYDPSRTVPAHWDRITLYRNSVLIWGNEPAGVQPGSSPTPTVQPSKTPTPIPQPTQAPTVQPSKTPTPTAPPELLTNGNAESGTSGWAIFGSGTLAANTSVVHGGAQSMLITGRTAAWNGISQNLTSKLTNGRSYTTNVWMRMQSGTTTGKVMMAVVADGSTSYVTLATGAVSSSGWTLLSGTATVSWSGTLSSAIFYVETTSGTDSFYIDDASFR